MERLFQDADVKIFFTTVEKESPPVQRAYSLPTILLPSVEELISPGEVPRFPYSKTYAQAARDPIIVCCPICESTSRNVDSASGLPHIRNHRISKVQGLVQQPCGRNGRGPEHTTFPRTRCV